MSFILLGAMVVFDFMMCRTVFRGIMGSWEPFSACQTQHKKQV